ncbi:bacteriocin immunity protein [Lacticaseibacillus sp. GG6-2]
MDNDTQAIFDLIDTAYNEEYTNPLSQQYHQILLEHAQALANGEPMAKTRLALYLALYNLRGFRPMTLPPAGRALYGTLHDYYRDVDAKALRHQALAYGLIAASGTW